ncbi:hypothetical protein E2C01_040082 [Portunus trituberculatus]|uniref:Uncharacterized protein n=1 Tax=Portunus trituberculatus TaxID=210409 RepID=A0A5B7FMM9_PORTR|nr:hypothetical protein [Portunus trituberculatus]
MKTHAPSRLQWDTCTNRLKGVKSFERHPVRVSIESIRV